jgi:uncharacterized protein (TIGR00251 family)
VDLSALKVTASGDGVDVLVHARPRAGKSAVRGVAEGALEVAITAPPVDGEANDELVRFLARGLGVAKRDVRIVRGESGRHKRVHIARIDEAELRARLAAHLVG